MVVVSHVYNTVLPLAKTGVEVRPNAKSSQENMTAGCNVHTPIISAFSGMRVPRPKLMKLNYLR